jgi:hypothetical protein
LRSFLHTLTFFKKANRPRRFWVWFFLFYHKVHQGFTKEHKVLFADSPEGTSLIKALKARSVTAMGVTHGIEGP